MQSLYHSINLDIKTAFLYGDIDVEIYTYQSESFDTGDGRVWRRLTKSLYELKQSLRQWCHKFTSFLKKIGFNQSSDNPSVFFINTRVCFSCPVQV